MGVIQFFQKKSLEFVPNKIVLTLMGTFLILSASSFVLSIQEELALKEYYRQNPLTHIGTWSFFHGIQGFLLLGGAWAVYRRTFFSWIFSAFAIMLCLMFYKIPYIVRVFTWGSLVTRNDKEWAGIYPFLKSLDSVFVFHDFDFVIIAFMVIILAGQMIALAWYGIHNEYWVGLFSLLVLLLFFIVILVRNYQTWPTRDELLQLKNDSLGKVSH